MYLSVAVSVWVALTSGELLPGEQVAVLVLLPLGIFEFIQVLPNALQAKAKARVSEVNLRSLLDVKVAPELEFTGTETLEQFEDLNLDDVKVTYPTGQIISLPNFQMKKGESISLLAASGAGKTTFANTLVGFIKTSAGRFEINGTQIEKFSAEALRVIVGLVEQEPVVLAGSIRDNLVLAKPDASDDELISALTDVNLWAMLANREGLETQVGNLGKRLSGGEAQRLALARNFLANRQLIILDEPTASVDEKLATELIEKFVELAKQRGVAVILITHDRKLAKLTSRSVQF
jgi:ABC-type transport system involved in cytochrome bd biosynthesis fused ATPase/permease subunit